ncbi:MAG: FRG domain-containing protein [Gammaproteobacteria bacterium]|nr:FRG domain-containing protein [Gammaproteobacteria bacterium]
MRSSSWDLSTTYARFMNEHRPDLLKHNNRPTQSLAEKRLLKEFIQNLIINNDFPNLELDIESDDTEIWELGQHFGLPSPLLDWTKSPYIALFFALHEKLEPDLSPSIWLLDQDCLEICQKILSNDENSPAIKLDIIEPKFTKNKRVAYQQGLFSRANIHSSHDAIEDKWRNDRNIKTGDFIFQKLTFHCTEDERQAMLLNLDKMNINYRTLFPDIDGSVKYAKQKLVLELAQTKGSSFSFGM